MDSRNHWPARGSRRSVNVRKAEFAARPIICLPKALVQASVGRHSKARWPRPDGGQVKGFGTLKVSDRAAAGETADWVDGFNAFEER